MATTVQRQQFSVDDVYEDVRRQTLDMSISTLVSKLAWGIGRRSVARLTKTSDPSTISRWIKERAQPSLINLQRVREGYCVYETMHRYFQSDVVAEQWLTGACARFDYGMPLDALADGRIRDVVAAMKADILR